MGCFICHKVLKSKYLQNLNKHSFLNKTIFYTHPNIAVHGRERRRETDGFNKTDVVHFSAPQCKWTAPVWLTALVLCACRPDGCGIGLQIPVILQNFLTLNIKLLLIFLLICSVIIPRARERRVCHCKALSSPSPNRISDSSRN